MNNELVIEIAENAQDVLANFPYRTGQHIESDTGLSIIINLDDWTGVTTEQEQFLDTNDDVLRYDIWSTVS